MSRSRPLIAFVAAAVWALNLLLCSDLVSRLVGPSHATQTTRRPATTLESSIVLAALAIEPNVQYRRYAGNFENPFRPSHGSSGDILPQEASSQQPRHGLSLKGVLVRRRPMAILEDETGKTWICGQGDTAAGAVVLTITGERVTLRGGRGSFDLTVKE